MQTMKEQWTNFLSEISQQKEYCRTCHEKYHQNHQYVLIISFRAIYDSFMMKAGGRQLTTHLWIDFSE